MHGHSSDLARPTTPHLSAPFGRAVSCWSSLPHISKRLLHRDRSSSPKSNHAVPPARRGVDWWGVAHLVPVFDMAPAHNGGEFARAFNRFAPPQPLNPEAFRTIRQNPVFELYVAKVVRNGGHAHMPVMNPARTVRALKHRASQTQRDATHLGRITQRRAARLKRLMATPPMSLPRSGEGARAPPAGARIFNSPPTTLCRAGLRVRAPPWRAHAIQKTNNPRLAGSPARSRAFVLSSYASTYAPDVQCNSVKSEPSSIRCRMRVIEDCSVRCEAVKWRLRRSLFSGLVRAPMVSASSSGVSFANT
jgi:hypothetical protein